MLYLQVTEVRSQKLASIGQVAAGVAHELNNPLSVILGCTKLLRADPGPHAENLAIIDNEGRQCQRIVAKLLISHVRIGSTFSLSTSPSSHARPSTGSKTPVPCRTAA
jgi:signal transduction histidine kinase